MKNKFHNLVVKILSKIYKNRVTINNTPSIPKGDFRIEKKEGNENDD